VTALEEGPWPAARNWQVSDLRTDYFGTALQQRVDAYDEQLTGEPQYRRAALSHPGSARPRRPRDWSSR
jgi:hypothetical protein